MNKLITPKISLISSQVNLSTNAIYILVVKLCHKVTKLMTVVNSEISFCQNTYKKLLKQKSKRT